MYDAFRHHRRSLRIKGYEYASEGAYFVTICTQFQALLLDSDCIRQIVQKTWEDLPDRFSNIRLDEFVIMPNHVHGIIWIVGAPLGAPRNDGAYTGAVGDARMGAADSTRTGAADSTPTGAASSAPTLGQVVRAFKSCSAITVNRHLHRSGRPLWQRNYFERIIRNDRELNAIRQYIRDNPKNWERDPENQPYKIY